MIQRVARAEVRVDGDVVGSTARGMLVLLGVLRGDGPAEADRLAERVAHFRIFPSADRPIDVGALDAGPDAPLGALVVSQFTLAADGRKGRRPSFDRAAPPAEAEALYDRFCARLSALGLPVAQGRFGASMQVELVNDGPVTFVLDEPRTT